LAHALQLRLFGTTTQCYLALLRLGVLLPQQLKLFVELLVFQATLAATLRQKPRHLLVLHRELLLLTLFFANVLLEFVLLVLALLLALLLAPFVCHVYVLR
jgi:hypothetical protein